MIYSHNTTKDVCPIVDAVWDSVSALQVNLDFMYNVCVRAYYKPNLRSLIFITNHKFMILFSSKDQGRVDFVMYHIISLDNKMYR